IEAILAGNIGEPPLPHLSAVSGNTFFICELSSHQLDRLCSSPHIAVLLNIVPEHLDYYEGFSEYTAAKENITRFQNDSDFFVYNADFPLPRTIASRTRARLVPFSAKGPVQSGGYVRDGTIVFAQKGTEEEILSCSEIPLLGSFNVQNVLAATVVGRLLGVPAHTIRSAVRAFRALPHRLELVGTYGGIEFYDDSLATAPEACLVALETLGSDVQTLILGGHERNLDFSELGKRLVSSTVDVLILFPPTGKRIWDSVISNRSPETQVPKAFFVDTMEEAVRLAFEHTQPGKICLLAPASASFGSFRDYLDRADSFKRWIREISTNPPKSSNRV
ncbi:MAG: UDP-N-acetylmuramoyl-L-alanine--D-glutamate ligase, partial [Acidobacteria bacterium]|nr:UDP-N-acetylmuramoyl-L-alanine--D-glutamate ligase [Acidobacteriota bacterium]